MFVHESAIPVDRRRHAIRRGATVVSALALLTASATAAGLAHPLHASASPGCGNILSWDFDLDGSRDLAVGAPASEPASGDPQVQLQLTNKGKHRHVAIPAPKGAFDFGSALASVSSHEADSDTSFCTQLAIGAPGEMVDGQPGAGAVYLYKWNGTKLVLRGKYVQGSNGVPGTPQSGGRFGSSLASFPLSDGSVDGAVPLYVGAPGHDVGYVTKAGTVTELTIHDTPDGRADGVTMDLRSPGIPGEPSKDGLLGASIAAAGDVVTVGSPGHRISGGTRDGEGAVLTFTRRSGRVTSPHLLTQATDGVAGNPEPGDNFGSSVSSVALGGPGSPVETLVGAPGESIGNTPYAGAALRFRTDPTTGTVGNFHGYQQGSGGVGGTPEEDDGFGTSVSIQRRPGSTPLRLVGVPFEDVGTVPEAGAVNEVGATTNRLWVQGRSGSAAVPGVPEAGDHLGRSVSGDSGMIAGIPGENGYGMVFGPWGLVGPLTKIPLGEFGTTVH